MKVYEHPEYHALLARCRERPDDDTPRLIMADWFEGNGDAPLAEFIRVQIHLARGGQCQACDGHGLIAEDGRGASEGTTCEACRGFGDVSTGLRRRERTLWPTVREWFRIAPELAVHSEPVLPADPILPAAVVRRGFIAEVHCTLTEWYEICLECGGYRNVHALAECHSDFTGIGPEIARHGILERVTLTDQQPYPNDGSEQCAWFHWSVPSRQGLYEGLFELLDGYDNNGEYPTKVRWYHTREDASNALSRAAIQWAINTNRDR